MAPRGDGSASWLGAIVKKSDCLEITARQKNLTIKFGSEAGPKNSSVHKDERGSTARHFVKLVRFSEAGSFWKNYFSRISPAPRILYC
jgi:hypothetical protein